jgi:biofilm protein TabA
MIYDTFEHIDLYFQPGTRLHQALVYARDAAADLADGRTDIDGDRLYASVATYDTGSREERRFEAHKKYIDVQVLLEGEEIIDVSLERSLAVLEDYDESRDVMFLKPPGEFASITMKSGRWAVFYPHDVHRPGCHPEGRRRVRKIVMKVHLPQTPLDDHDPLRWPSFA